MTSSHAPPDDVDKVNNQQKKKQKNLPGKELIHTNPHTLTHTRKVGMFRGLCNWEAVWWFATGV